MNDYYYSVIKEGDGYVGRVIEHTDPYPIDTELMKTIPHKTEQEAIEHCERWCRENGILAYHEKDLW